MRDHLIVEPKKKNRSVFVLQGIGGAGKSEVAVQFAIENQDRFVLADRAKLYLLTESAFGASFG